MERRLALPIAFVAVLLMLCIPMGESDGAVSGEDISVSLTTEYVTESVTETEIHVSTVVTVKNGQSMTFNIFLDNESSTYLSVTPGKAVSSNGVKITTEVDNRIISPIDDDMYSHISTATVEVTIDNYIDTKHEVLVPFITLRETTDYGLDTVTVFITVDVEVADSFGTGGMYNKFMGIVPNTLPSPADSVWVTVVVTLVIWLLLTYVVVKCIVPILARIVGYRKSAEEKGVLTKGLMKTISLLMVIVALNQCFIIAGASSNMQHILQMVSTPLAVLVLSYIVWQIYMFLITAFFTGMHESGDVEGVDSSLIPLFRMLGKLIIAVGATAAILASFGVDLGGILVSAGVVSLGITLGAQSTLNQFFSGLVLLSTRPFKKGDFVKINGEVYIVQKVRIMFTEFKNWGKDQIITMPNNVVTGATMVNLTRDSKNTVIYVYMEVAYNANLSLAKELMLKAAKMHPHVVTEGDVYMPNTRLTQFMDSGIEYRLGCTVDDFDNSASYAGQIREIIYKLFKDNGVEIPYNRLEVTLLPCDGQKKPTDTVDRFRGFRSAEGLQSPSRHP